MGTEAGLDILSTGQLLAFSHPGFHNVSKKGGGYKRMGAGEPGKVAVNWTNGRQGNPVKSEN